mmetsp:Transcript_17786/g.36866  ORF Transcript_17786/g.36866 Transcript_17786/m.36866 type:complete len:363 (+) Transcript_17786:190-1278(+)
MSSPQHHHQRQYEHQLSPPCHPHQHSSPPNMPRMPSSPAPSYHYQNQRQHRAILPPISLVSTCEEMNPSRRSSFEDCSIYAPSGSWNCPDENMAMLAVADGHGGRDIVEFLEDALLYHVSEELQLYQPDEADVDPVSSSSSSSCTRDQQLTIQNDSIPARLERAFLITDIHSKAMELMSSGATVAMCLVTRGSNNIYNSNCGLNKNVNNDNMENTWTIYAANAGDARIVLGHGGRAYRMTKDHRTDDPEEVQRIEESGGFIFKGRVLGILAVTRSLGDHCMKEYVIAKPYTSEKTITVTSERDISFIILACDGLWDVFRDQEAVDFVLDRIAEKELVAKYLVEEALKKGSTDNITVSVAFLT